MKPAPIPSSPWQQAPLSRYWRACIAVFCALALAQISGLAHADSDHDRAREAMQAGEVLPLATILDGVAREHAGKILDVELDRDKDDGEVYWVYKVKVLQAGGKLLKLKIDARTGALISRKHKD